MTLAKPNDLLLASAPILPYAFAKANHVLAWQDKQEQAVRLIYTAQTPRSALAEVARLYGGYTSQCAGQAQFDNALQTQYGQSAQQGSAQSVADAAGQELDLNRLMDDIPEVQDLLDSAADAPIIKLINALLTQAVREGASDVHIEPFEQATVVRLRVDGTLRDIARPKRSLHAALISRIKIMASLDIAERRMPQDGRMALRVAGRPVDVRVSTLPVGSAANAAQGAERAVLRLLDKSEARLDLTALGMALPTREAVDKLIKQPYGIVLVTGPTGSGKTTSLYSAIKRLDASTTNILTVEDPIEYELTGIGQTQVNPKIDLNFATALRAILRQDPDVVMIGEIRDVETASIAVQASLTGHLVLATLHTNDAVGAVTRLVDMGVEPFLLSSSLIGVLAQRLVRQLCNDCKVLADIDVNDSANYSTNNSASNDARNGENSGAKNHTHNHTHRPDLLRGKQYKALGCSRCNHTGYVGRVGIYELLSVNANLAQAIHQGMAEADLRAMAIAQGFTTLRQDAQRLIDSGVTSLAEVERVTRLA